MLLAERHRKIVGIVNERMSIRVSELSQLFHVTEETIRRDLEKLEKEHLLKRSHGGAVSIEPDQVETSYEEREILHAIDKKAIAKEAIKLIKPMDKIVLDASTTAWYMAKELPDMPLTVITNSIKVAMELGKKEQMKVISTGGELLPKSLSYVGHLAERSLDMYYVNKAFISCKGVEIERGLSESNEWQALLKKKMMDIADESILLVDHTKFYNRAFVSFAPINKVNQIITDNRVDKTIVESIKEKNIKVKATIAEEI